MTAEDKIKEAFEAEFGDPVNRSVVAMKYFRAGYMACLNSLEQCGTINSTGHPKHPSHIYGTYELQVYGNPAPVFRLPEGVTKP